MKYPDYSTRQVLALNTQHIILTDGWLQTEITCYDSDFRLLLYINGALAAYNHYHGSGCTEMIPVKAGDVIRCNSQYFGGFGALYYFVAR